jgi:hypothetical protein
VFPDEALERKDFRDREIERLVRLILKDAH